MTHNDRTEGKYFGTVQYCAERLGKAFGYVVQDTTGDVVTFDREAYRPLVIGEKDRLVFADRDVTMTRLPQKGDVLIFTKITFGNRIRMKRWAFIDEYDELLSDMDIMTIDEADRYRVCTKYDFEDTATILFEGPLGELVVKYPLPSENGRHDRMVKEEHCDTFTVKRWFERLDRDGSWKECNDPRIKIDAITLRRIALAKF